MKWTIVATMACLCLMSCGQNNHQEPVNSSKKAIIMQTAEKEKIEALLSEYKKALNNSDATLAKSLYSKDGVFMPSAAPSAIGLENIHGAYEFIFSQIQLHIEFYIDEIVIENDLAFATTSSKGTTLIHATGQTVPEANRELFVFKKEAGNWKIARYMFNKTEAVPAS